MENTKIKTVFGKFNSNKVIKILIDLIAMEYPEVLAIIVGFQYLLLIFACIFNHPIQENIEQLKSMGNSSN